MAGGVEPLSVYQGGVSSSDGLGAGKISDLDHHVLLKALSTTSCGVRQTLQAGSSTGPDHQVGLNQGGHLCLGADTA